MEVGHYCAVAGGVIGFVGSLFVRTWGKARACPECRSPLPRFRRPSGWGQALRGGWTCHNCGCEVDRRGRVLVVMGRG